MSALFDETVKVWDTTDGTCLQALDIGRSLQNISFNKTGSFLRTETGAFRLQTQSAPRLRQNIGNGGALHRHGFGLSIDRKWVTQESAMASARLPTKILISHSISNSYRATQADGFSPSAFGTIQNELLNCSRTLKLHESHGKSESFRRHA